MTEKDASFQRHMSAIHKEGDTAGLYYPLGDVAAAASACKAWFCSEGIAMTDVGLMAMTRLVLDQRQISRMAPVADDVVFAVDREAGGMSWTGPSERPDLTPEKALVVAVANGASAIGGALDAVANALEMISQRLPDA